MPGEYTQAQYDERETFERKMNNVTLLGAYLSDGVRSPEDRRIKESLEAKKVL